MVEVAPVMVIVLALEATRLPVTLKAAATLNDAVVVTPEPLMTKLP